MKRLIVLVALLYLNIGKPDAQTKVHYLVSSNHLLVGDSAKITPIILNAKPNTKVELIASDFQNDIIKTNSDPFYYNSYFSGRSELMVALKLSSNNKTYFIDTQYLSFYNFKIKANIYSVQNPFIAFVGIQNPFELDIPGISHNDVVISCKGLTIHKENESRFNIYCSHAGEGEIAIAVKKDDGNLVMVKKIPVIIKIAPTPSIVTYISNADSSIQLNSVLNDQFILNYSSGVDSFTIVYEKAGKKITKIFSGNKIDTKTYLEIMSLPKGTWLYFENIEHWISLWGPKKYCTSNIAIKL